MSKRVYLVTLHTGNSLTVHSHKFVRGREVVVEDEDLVNYLKGHPNFTIKAMRIGDEAIPEVAPVSEAPADSGGVNTTDDLDGSGMSAKVPVTNVAKAPVKRNKTSA